MISWKPWFLRARLKTRHLLLISAIGEKGNINRAAEDLNMSQPAASRLLRDVEEIVGADLFERLPRGGFSKMRSSSPSSRETSPTTMPPVASSRSSRSSSHVPWSQRRAVTKNRRRKKSRPPSYAAPALE